MNGIQLAGKKDITGNGIFEFPSDTVFVPRGLDIKYETGVKENDIFRANTWGSITPSNTKLKKIDGVRLQQDTWIKQRSRGQQYGFRASETSQYGPEDPPISNTQIPTVKTGTISAEVYNISTASYLAGHAELPSNLGRDLSVDRVLQRAPGDLLITKNNTYDDQRIVCPGGYSSGYQSRAFFR